ncbi:MAG: Flp family type IVb pilin [Planctomycetes bacterium]|jgi:Flp pilus assembly pilin Flp|nr:Flp family type IVb pilin [Phycisphaerae bacterium]NBB96156.1 Flp family type IVb pilin [Planctomycetota bacterium]
MNLIRNIRTTLGRLHRDERGADMVEYALIVLAIALPLIGVIIVFRDELWELITGQWEDVQDDYEMNP